MVGLTLLSLGEQQGKGKGTMTYSEMLHRNMTLRQAATADRAAKDWVEEGYAVEAQYWLDRAASLRLSLEV